MKSDFEKFISELKSMSKEDKERFAYVDRREDLFPSKILEIFPEEKRKDKPNFFIASRDPGSGNALSPVIKLLKEKANLIALTDGRAKETLVQNFSTNDITPEEILEFGAIPNPDLILSDVSHSNFGLEKFLRATFLESADGHIIPLVLVEDIYTNCLPFLEWAKKYGLPLPNKVCVMDQAAKEIIIENFPEMENRIEITGQPAFDRFKDEKVAEISKNVREKLGLTSDDKLVAFMSSMEPIEQTKRMLEELAKSKQKFILAFRRHPRDTVSWEEYCQIIQDFGLEAIDSHALNLSTDEVCMAADLVITTWSTVGLDAIYRRKLSIHILDTKLQNDLPQDVISVLPWPPVRLGASAGVDNVKDLPYVVDRLLDPASELNISLKKNMKKYYPNDGDNTQRVVDVIFDLLNKQE